MATQLAYASCPLQKLPKVSKDGLVVTPEKERNSLEKIIETSANLVSVANRTARSITSPTPCIAFHAENEEEKRWLSSKKGILYKSRQFSPVGTMLGVDILKHLEHLNDRLDGIALISEAMCHSHLGGRFHEYFRLFERAFKLSSKLLIGPLVEYFENSRYGYCSDEVERWVKMRHGLAHPDLKEHFLLEKDVASIVPRIEQAAFDILFNKQIWRSRNTDRRELWKPTCGTEKDTIFLVKDSQMQIECTFMDDFGVFKLNMKKAALPLPEELWSGVDTPDFGKPGADISTSSGPIASV